MIFSAGYGTSDKSEPESIANNITELQVDWNDDLHWNPFFGKKLMSTL
jgi:hypothetical protein